MTTIFDLITEAIREQLRAGRTQADLARELGLSQATVSAIRRGTRRVGRKTAEAVLTANPPWLQLFLGRRSPSSPPFGGAAVPARWLGRNERGDA